MSAFVEQPMTDSPFPGGGMSDLSMNPKVREAFEGLPADRDIRGRAMQGDPATYLERCEAELDKAREVVVAAVVEALAEGEEGLDWREGYPGQAVSHTSYLDRDAMDRQHRAKLGALRAKLAEVEAERNALIAQREMNYKPCTEAP